MFSKNALLRVGCIVVLLISFTGTSFGGDPLFPWFKGYNSGGRWAMLIAVSDVNADHKPDLIVANAYNVVVMLGNGDGTFQVPTQVYDNGGNAPIALAVGDVNGDARPDLLVADAECMIRPCDGALLAVLLGNGDGTFQAVRTISRDRVNSMVLADVNGDGDLDLLVSSTDVGVMLGNGDGTFQGFQKVKPGGASALAVGDVNQDGRPDLLAATSDQVAVVAVLLGNGDGTFLAPLTYETGSYQTKAIAIADVNGDNKPDLAVANNGTAGGLLGNGDGTFQAVQNYDAEDFGPHSIAVRDVSGDGKPDIIIGNQGHIGVFLGHGDGSFDNVILYHSGENVSVSMVVEDVSGDGRPDVLVANACDTRQACSHGVIRVMLGRARFITTTTLNSNPNPSVYGQEITLTAIVGSVGPNAPTGLVTFKYGTTALGSPKLIGGVATVTRRHLPVGVLSITATYNGNVQSAGSTSARLIQVVNP